MNDYIVIILILVVKIYLIIMNKDQSHKGMFLADNLLHNAES